jgi:hypothetical protein
MDTIGVVSELCGNDPEIIVRNTANDNHTVTVYPIRSPMSAGILNVFWICFLIFTISSIIVFLVAGLKY